MKLKSKTQKLSCLLACFIGGASVSNGALGFTINVNYTGTPGEEALFTAAAAAWEGRITGYRGVMSLASVTINAVVEPIDGPGGILGSAGPTFVSIQDEDGVAGGNEFALASEGDMTFDSADSLALTAAVIEHEMGHVLGIGTLWNTASFGGAFANTQNVYTNGTGQYTGAFGLAAYNSEFSQVGAFVPVELGGGGGTANGHWNEVDNGAGPTGIVSNITGQDFRNELMTGWLNSPTFVSSLTTESLRDIGYTVATSAVPEPSSVLLLGMGSFALIMRRRK